MGNVKKTVGLVCLGALCVLMIVLGVRTAGYVQLTREEAATTPTAEPVGGNVMVVTPDPITTFSIESFWLDHGTVRPEP